MQRLVVVRRVRLVERLEVRLVERLDVMERKKVWCASRRSTVDVKVCNSVHTTAIRARRTSKPAATPARADPDAAANVVVVQRAQVSKVHHSLELDLREQKFCFLGDVVLIRVHHHHHHHHQVVRVLVVTGRGALGAR